jgi:hypothetical protein
MKKQIVVPEIHFFDFLLDLFHRVLEPHERPSVYTQRLRCEYLYLCTSKACKLSTCDAAEPQVSVFALVY